MGGMVSGWMHDGWMMDGWMDGWMDNLEYGGARIEVPPSKGASCAFIFAGLFTEKDTWILWNIEDRSDMAQESMWNILITIWIEDFSPLFVGELRVC